MTVTSKTYLFGCHTDRGPRDTNQDAVLSTELPGGRWLVAVADGMGGLEAGDLASRTALQVFRESLKAGLGLEEAVQKANSAVFQEAQGIPTGTTLVAALTSDQGIEIVNVGDSRAYHLDPMGFVQITRDHTMAEEAARLGTDLGGQAASAAWAGSLARFLGEGDTVQADRFGPVDLHEGGWLLLCSDGLHGVLSADDLELCLLKESDPTEGAAHLVAAALEANTLDNVSVALIYRPEKETQPAPAGTIPYEATSWDLDKLLARSKRSPYRRQKSWLKIVSISVVVALVVTLAIAFIWGRVL
jgi:serine/threonine protein phosphatase PrpC